MVMAWWITNDKQSAEPMMANVWHVMEGEWSVTIKIIHSKSPITINIYYAPFWKYKKYSESPNSTVCYNMIFYLSNTVDIDGLVLELMGIRSYSNWYTPMHYQLFKC